MNQQLIRSPCRYIDIPSVGSKNRYARWTRPLFRQRVQTFILLGTPSTMTWTLFILARWRCFARREICERVIFIFLPKNISFWQISHLAMLYLLTFGAFNRIHPRKSAK